GEGGRCVRFSAGKRGVSAAAAPERRRGGGVSHRAGGALYPLRVLPVPGTLNVSSGTTREWATGHENQPRKHEDPRRGRRRPGFLLRDLRDLRGFVVAFCEV